MMTGLITTICGHLPVAVLDFNSWVCNPNVFPELLVIEAILCNVTVANYHYQIRSFGYVLNVNSM